MLEFGFSKVRITPSQDMELSGFVGRVGKSTGVHDDLHCRSLVLAEASEKIVLTSCDLLGIPEELVSRVRHRLGSLARPEQVMIMATHTHSAPPVIMFRPTYPNKEYLAFVEDMILESIRLAFQEMSRGRMRIGSSEATGLCVNRIDPGLGVDDSVITVEVYGEGRGVRIVNFACHPITMGPWSSLISSDYPHYLYEYHGSRGFEVIFMNGAAGDVNPSVVGVKGAERIGYALGEASEAIGAEIETSLGSLSLTTNLDLGPINKLKVLLELVIYGTVGMAGNPWARAMYQWANDVLSTGDPPMARRIEIQGMRLSSDVAIVSCPCELFTALGLRVKSKAPFNRLLIAGYANGLVGYVPTLEAFRRRTYEAAKAYRFYDLLPFSDAVGDEVAEAMLSVVRALGVR